MNVATHTARRRIVVMLAALAATSALAQNTVKPSHSLVFALITPRAAQQTRENWQPFVDRMGVARGEVQRWRLIDSAFRDSMFLRLEGHALHEIALDGYGYRWFRIGAVDETLTRAPF